MNTHQVNVRRMGSGPPSSLPLPTLALPWVSPASTLHAQSPGTRVFPHTQPSTWLQVNGQAPPQTEAPGLSPDYLLNLSLLHLWGVGHSWALGQRRTLVTPTLCLSASVYPYVKPGLHQPLVALQVWEMLILKPWWLFGRKMLYFHDFVL